MTRWIASLVFVASSLGVVLACSGGDGGTPPAGGCTPGAERYCRCADLNESGLQVCDEQGVAYSRCEPCYEDYDDGDAQVCSPGTSVACRCLDGNLGNQDCADDGFGFDECLCEVDAGLCGNGQVDPGESCDDGNDQPNDGCDACQAGGDPLDRSICPGVAVHLWGPTYGLRGSTTGASAVHTGEACGERGITGGAAVDRVYRLVAERAGTLKVAVKRTDFAMALFVRAVCDDIGSQSACSLAEAGSSDTVLELPGLAAKDAVYLTVDGQQQSDEGSFQLDLSIE